MFPFFPGFFLITLLILVIHIHQVKYLRYWKWGDVWNKKLGWKILNFFCLNRFKEIAIKIISKSGFGHFDDFSIQKTHHRKRQTHLKSFEWIYTINILKQYFIEVVAKEDLKNWVNKMSFSIGTCKSCRNLGVT